MHLAHSLPESKVSRLQDRTAALLADGYRIGYRHGVWRGSLYGFAAACALAFCALVTREAFADQYPLGPEVQKRLLQRASELYIHWPEGRELPKPQLLWKSPEWFQITRGMTERAAWGSVDAGNVVMNEYVLRHEFLSRTPVLESLAVHEYVHILQRELSGPVTDCMDLARREREAYSVQAAYLRLEGVNLVLTTEEPECGP